MDKFFNALGKFVCIIVPLIVLFTIWAWSVNNLHHSLEPEKRDGIVRTWDDSDNYPCEFCGYGATPIDPENYYTDPYGRPWSTYWLGKYCIHYVHPKHWEC